MSDSFVLDPLIRYGFDGVIISLLAVQVFYLQRKLIEVVENNTRAMTELQDTVDKWLTGKR